MTETVERESTIRRRALICLCLPDNDIPVVELVKCPTDRYLA